MQALLILFLPFAILLISGVPVAFSFLVIMLVGTVVFMDASVGPFTAVLSVYNSLASFCLLPVPFFILMGLILFNSGVATRAIDALAMLFGKLPGRLCFLTIAGSALFGMLSGTTMASVALFGSTLAPEMIKRGYSKELSYGSIMGAGGLAMIIPPSSLAVIYGTVAEISIGRLLLAGFIPGIIMTINYTIQVLLRIKLNPSIAPPYDVEQHKAGEKLKKIFLDILPLGFLVFLVTGVFVLGVATPTEASVLGAVGSILVVAAYGRLDRKVLFNSLSGTIVLTTVTLFIISGATVYSQLLSFSGALRLIVGVITGLSISPLAILSLMILVVLIFGTFMESVPIIMICVPMFVPIANHLGFNPFWFGLIFLLCIQMGLTSPPFGTLLFVMKSVAPKGTEMKTIYRSAIPFLLSDCVTMAILIAFPYTVLWLPELLLG